MYEDSTWVLDETFFKSSGKRRTPEQIEAEIVRKKLNEVRDLIDLSNQQKEVWDD